ncbi:putative F-box protein At5g55150 [Silene latifolia]|uniref:putative F-box protein At5g55150 n=1 Tax=Silene latifolia TaxID=37657 RepID=UPI003D7854EA
MANWSELIPLDIWKKIAESIQFHEDFNVFGRVCSDWRKAMKIANRSKSSIQTPWLLLAEPPCTSTRRFYSLYNHKDEDGLGDWRYYSSRGWLISVTQLGLNITLVNPITKQVVQPPPFPDHIFGSRTRSWQWQPNSYLFMYDKFVLSEDPSTTKDYVLAMKFSASVDLAFWKSGDKQWNMLNTHSSSFLGHHFSQRRILCRGAIWKNYSRRKLKSPINAKARGKFNVPMHVPSLVLLGRISRNIAADISGIRRS